MKIRKIKLTKLSWKLALLYALVFATVLVVLNASVLYGVKYFIINQVVQRVDSISSAVEKRVIGTDSEQMSLNDPELIYESRNDKTLNIKIADPSGLIVNDSKNFKTLGIPMKEHVNKVQQLENGELILVVRNNQVSVGGKLKATIQVTQNIDKEYNFLNILLIFMAIADVLGIILALLAGYLLSRKMLRPIDKMTKTANEIGLSGLSTRIDVPPADDELSRLAKTFNEMLDRINVAFEKQGRFVADASHELRTPVAIIQGYIGMMDRWGKKDSKVLQESIDAIKTETASMTLMIERLLFLARGDNGSQLLQKTWFSIAELFDELYRESEMLAPGHEFIFQGTEGQKIFADRRMIKQMLRALLDNSIKFTPPHGKIELLCTKEGENTVFTVTDTGVGIPEAKKMFIFERFYRVDKARARETGGSGLGLSIVKWIVDVHDGRIEIDSIVEKGTRIVVTLPNLTKK